MGRVKIELEHKIDYDFDTKYVYTMQICNI